jgi:hypothetical protein
MTIGPERFWGNNMGGRVVLKIILLYTGDNYWWVSYLMDVQVTIELMKEDMMSATIDILLSAFSDELEQTTHRYAPFVKKSRRRRIS